MPPLAQTITVEPSEAPPASATEPAEFLVPSRETFSAAEAARILDYEESVLRLLCRRGVIPTHKVDDELQINRADLVPYYRKVMRIREHFRRSRFLKEMDELNAELEEAGLY